MAAAHTIPFEQPEAEQLTTKEQFERFDRWFSRCHKTLHFTARLILGGSELAASAVKNCWFSASRNPLHFESEGSFRSWIVRLLISEALSIVIQRSPGTYEITNIREFREK